MENPPLEEYIENVLDVLLGSTSWDHRLSSEVMKINAKVDALLGSSGGALRKSLPAQRSVEGTSIALLGVIVAGKSLDP